MREERREIGSRGIQAGEICALASGKKNGVKKEK